jgi:hypothetical protein
MSTHTPRCPILLAHYLMQNREEVMAKTRGDIGRPTAAHGSVTMHALRWEIPTIALPHRPGSFRALVPSALTSTLGMISCPELRPGRGIAAAGGSLSSSHRVTPGLQRREVGGYSFYFFSLSVVAFWEFGIWGKTFTSRAVEFLWLGACIGVGSRRVGVLGRKSCFGPLTPITLAALPLTPHSLCSPPIPLPSWPPPSHLLLSQALAATHQTLAALPPISSSHGAIRCRSDLRHVVQIFNGSVEGGREE